MTQCWTSLAIGRAFTRALGRALLVVLASVVWSGALHAQAPDLGPDATSAEVDAVVAELGARAEEDGFPAVRSEFETLITNPALPPTVRSRLLRAAMTQARKQRNPDFQAPAARLYDELVDQLPPGPERSRLTQSRAVFELDRGRFVEAERFYLDADRESADRPMTERANLMTGLGVTRAQQGKLDEALEAMLEAYARYERTEEGPAPNLLRNIGGLSIYLEDYERAIDFTRQAIERLGPTHPDTPGAYSNLAAALVELGRTDEAMATLEQGIAIADAQARPNSALLSNLGFIQYEAGEYETALATFERTAELNRSAGDTASLAITWKNIGDTRVGLGRREEAAEAFDRSLALYQEADIKPKRLELYEPLIDNLEALGRYPEALERMNEWRLLAEELVSADAQTRIAELQSAFDLERRERELAESERLRLENKAELDALQNEQARANRLRWGLILGLAVLVVFLALMARLLRIKTRAHRLLAEKSAEVDVQRKALAEANRLLHRQSSEDELTGLANRRYLRRVLDSELPAAIRQRALLILIDLDHFKNINDRYGHPEGDRVLAEFADRLRQVAGPDDVLARWGGEEFLWLAADRPIEQAGAVCGRLSETLRREPMAVDGDSIRLTVSMGVAPVEFGDTPSEDFAVAVKLADAALYEAKQAGRDHWVGFERRSAESTGFDGSLDIPALIADGALARIGD